MGSEMCIRDRLIRVLPGFGGNNLVLAQPRFTPDPGVTATLSPGVSGFINVNEAGELIAPGNIPYNPASPDFGGAWVVTTADGITYRVNGATGELDSATDANGNTLTFSDTGISAEGVGEVVFQRDAQGRIASIVDLSGNTINYSYDAEGNLATVVDQLGNETTLVYSDVRPHFLETVIDPEGNDGVRGEYNDEGRLISLTDAEGNSLELSLIHI